MWSVSQSHWPRKSCHAGLDVGDRVNPVTESHDRVGWVVCRGSDAQGAGRRDEDVLHTVSIVTG